MCWKRFGMRSCTNTPVASKYLGMVKSTGEVNLWSLRYAASGRRSARLNSKATAPQWQYPLCYTCESLLDENIEKFGCCCYIPTVITFLWWTSL